MELGALDIKRAIGFNEEYLGTNNNKGMSILQDEECMNYVIDALEAMFAPCRHSKDNDRKLISVMNVVHKKYAQAQQTSIENMKKGTIESNKTEKYIEQMEQMQNEIKKVKDKNEILIKEVDIMKHKLRHALPVHSIVYMIGTSVTFAIFFTLLCLQVFKGIYIIHPYFVFTGMIGSIGLWATSLLTIKDWKEWLNTNER